jgi:ribosomal-protein-alanine N-acetyltransferase
MVSLLRRLRAALVGGPPLERPGPAALRIRPMAYRDLNAVSAIENVSFGGPWRVSSFARAVSDSNQCFVVAELDRQMVAYGGFWIEHGRAHIAKLAVHPAYRRRGIASILLQDLLERIRELGIGGAFLEVRRSNLPAQELYRRFAFRFERVQPHAYPNDGEDALVFVRDDLLDAPASSSETPTPEGPWNRRSS